MKKVALEKIMQMQQETRRIARIMKALSNENRLRLYLQIGHQEKIAIPHRECFVSDIAAKFNIGAPTISHHIKELEIAGLIHTSKIGKQVTATINKDTKHFVMMLFSG